MRLISNGLVEILHTFRPTSSERVTLPPTTVELLTQYLALWTSSSPTLSTGLRSRSSSTLEILWSEPSPMTTQRPSTASTTPKLLCASRWDPGSDVLMPQPLLMRRQSGPASGPVDHWTLAPPTPCMSRVSASRITDVVETTATVISLEATKVSSPPELAMVRPMRIPPPAPRPLLPLLQAHLSAPGPVVS